MTDKTSQDEKGCCAPNRNSLGAGPSVSRLQTSEKDPPPRVTVPGGEALVGTKALQLVADGEGPLRKARVRSFEMDETAVTNARFRQFVSDTGYVTEAETFGNSFVFFGFLDQQAQDAPDYGPAPWWRVVDGANWRTPAGPGSEALCIDDHPVVQVTWNDAQAFADWAGGRLPTEVEWEHAARGGLGDVRFPWGDQEPDDHGFFPCNIWQGDFPHHDLALDGYSGTAPARSFAPNSYGLYNMVGNTWEYTSQPFKVKSLKKEARKANAAKAGYKLAKGGSFLCHRSYCYRYRIAARTGSSPDSSTSHQGIRLVYDL